MRTTPCDLSRTVVVLSKVSLAIYILFQNFTHHFELVGGLPKFILSKMDVTNPCCLNHGIKLVHTLPLLIKLTNQLLQRVCVTLN